MVPLNIQLGGTLYETYAAAVGGKAFNGDPLPAWLVMQQDPNKQTQVKGWIAIGDAVALMLEERANAVRLGIQTATSIG
jgi:hypothetical protein